MNEFVLFIILVFSLIFLTLNVVIDQRLKAHAIAPAQKMAERAWV